MIASVRKALTSVATEIVTVGEGTGNDIVVPVADRAAVAFAVGLALAGKRPVVELSSTGRLPAVLEALAEAASVSRGGEFNVPLVLRVPYGGEAGPRVDRPVGDILASIPGLRVVCATPATAGSLLVQAVRSSDPVVFLEPRQGGAPGIDASLSEARVLRRGDHVTLVSWGAGVDVAQQVASTDEFSASVIDLVSLSPLDRATVAEDVTRTGRLVVVHPDDAGLAARVLRVGLDDAFLYLESPPAVAAASATEALRVARGSVFY